jgi:hypothetical protein
VTEEKAPAPDDGAPAPAPKESPYSFCQTVVLCYDCSGKPLNALDQLAVDARRTDDRCDDVRTRPLFALRLPCRVCARTRTLAFSPFCKVLALSRLAFHPSPCACCPRGTQLGTAILDLQSQLRAISVRRRRVSDDHHDNDACVLIELMLAVCARGVFFSLLP